MSYTTSLTANNPRRQPALFRSRHVDRSFVAGAALNADSLDMLETMQKVQAHDEDTLGSGSNSGYSDIIGPENETDTLGQAIMQHERDARRLQNALHAHARPILKTRPRPRISELLEKREREDALAANAEHSRNGSNGSSGSDPPLNVPREWGTRARSQRGWMRKIREPSETDIKLSPEVLSAINGRDDDAIVSRRTAYTGDDYFSPGSDDALPATDMTPPSITRQRPSSQPTAARPANSTLRHIMDSEEPDFGDLSLLESTPAGPRSRRRMNDLTRREMETLERQGVAKRNLDQLSERSPNGSLRQRRSREAVPPSPEHELDALGKDHYRPRTAPSIIAQDRITRRRSLIGNKENMPTNGVSTTTYKSTETVTITDRTAQAVTFKQPQRPAHARQDSMKLLQRLARVSSMSPSPARTSPETADPGVEKPSPSKPRARSGAGTHLDKLMANGDDLPDTETLGNRQPRRRVSLRSLRSQAESRASSEDTAGAKQEQNEATPTPAEQPVDTKTPVVTGAWVDTLGPETETDVRPLLRTTDSTILRAFGTPSGEATLETEEAANEKAAEYLRRAHSEPNRPRSALEDIVREARAQPAGPFGDATIQSLEDIANPNLDATDTTLTFDSRAVGDDADDSGSGRQLTQAEKDRRKEDLAIEAMNKHLRAARTSIKDANRGLRRVENQVETTQSIEPDVEPLVALQPRREVVLAKSDHTWRTTCTHCGGSYRKVWQGLWTEFRSNFYLYDRTAPLGIRPTWLGLLVLTWILWHLLEISLCSVYCHKTAAFTMRGYGVDPDAPRYPFVIPTLAFRPFRPLWKPAVQWLEAAFMTLFHLVFGEPQKKPQPLFMRPGFKITPEMINYDALYSPELAPRVVGGKKWTGTMVSSAVAATARTTARVAQSFVDAVDEVGRMGEDEYLT